MNTRTYTLKSRAVTAELTRGRILTATREVLASDEGIVVFSLEAVARAAGVTRATVYNQFGSKRGLIEALSDDLAARAAIGARLEAAFQSSTALEGLDALIAAFAHVWTVDRVIIRRLHGIAALDPEIGRSDDDRNQRRRDALAVILRRLQAERGLPVDELPAEIVALLHMLMSFEAMDQLAGDHRTPSDVVPIIRRLAREALGGDPEVSAAPSVLPVLPATPVLSSPHPVMSSDVETSPPSDTPPSEQQAPASSSPSPSS